MSINIAVNTFMQSIQNPVLTVLSKFIAIIFDSITLITTSLIIAVFLYFKKKEKQAIFLASTILTTGIIIKLLKEIFQRARPLIQESGFSFPSGHTTITIVFLGLIVYLFVDKKHKFAATLTATLIILFVGFTRIYLQVHWLTDVVGGIFIGGIILIASIKFIKKWDIYTTRE